eukprot:305350_1
MSNKKDIPCRITDDMLKKACDFQYIAQKYPFIRILPKTHPSKRGRKIDAFFYKQKMMMIQFAKSQQNKKKKNKKKKTPTKRFDFLKFIRDQQDKQTKILSIQDPNNCSLQKCNINGINCEWIKYKGSSIQNGIILVIHGGGYIMGSTLHKHRQSELMSKLTGCACLLINYSLAP